MSHCCRSCGLNRSPLLGIAGVTGWFVQKKLFWSLNEPPRPRLSLEREFFLMARPPLLCQGGDFASTPRSATTKCVYFPTQGNICICRTPLLQTGQSGVFSDDKSDEIG